MYAPSLKIFNLSTGRPFIPYKTMLKIPFCQNIKNVFYLSCLVKDLQDNYNLTLFFGFHLLYLLQVNNFSSFFRDTLKINFFKK